jgi:hypothetical protein
MQDAQDLQGQGFKVIVGERLRAFREYKALSQSDMEEPLGHFSLLHISGGEWAHDPDPGEPALHVEWPRREKAGGRNRTRNRLGQARNGIRVACLFEQARTTEI